MHVQTPECRCSGGGPCSTTRIGLFLKLTTGQTFIRKSQMPAYLQACGVGCEEVWGLAAAAAALRVGEKVGGEGQRAVEQRWIDTLHGAGGDAVIHIYPPYHNAVGQAA
jgi:hypothetical protein